MMKMTTTTAIDIGGGDCERPASRRRSSTKAGSSSVGSGSSNRRALIATRFWGRLY